VTKGQATAAASTNLVTTQRKRQSQPAADLFPGG
jgi:hypothetical protein